MALTGGLQEAGGQQLRGSNQSGMRAYNERLVLSLVRRHAVLVKTEIARMTGLSAQTISVIMRELEADGLLVRGEPIRGKVGQPSVPLSINPEGAFFIGLKVGRRSADLIVINFLGQPVASRHVGYAYPDPDAILAFVREGLSEMIAALGAGQQSRIAGLGIAMPFQLWNWHDEVGAPQVQMDRWRHFDLKREIDAICNFPVYLQNDATAACAAELIFGERASRQDFIYFYVGTFIGGGIVLNGSLYAGRNGNAGALGSMPVPGKEGRTEQLIDQASIMVLERMLVSDGIDPAPLWQAPEDWSRFDAHVDRWIATVATGLAYAIVASVSIIDFETVVIDGGMPQPVRDALVAATRAAIGAMDLQGIDMPTVEAGSIGPIARALGAASLPLFDKYLIDQHTLMREA
ncbi:ROK family transcriptional regulator [Rhizobium sp. EC-SD404]|uniref:ROK family transcriptional regulator n=1 Tax=Rhizobium sp. EC-SD404 TaxID=2038389 RepID=UPI0012567EFD|nr:ROK family transcriptional regulator [Rhizobium sp. EC-SD404]VVT04575.1 Sugar kinase [Rhizobium sp. EC-SD404]